MDDTQATHTCLVSTSFMLHHCDIPINENRVERVTLGDQRHGGPMRALYPGLHWKTNEMGVNEIRIEKVTLGHQ